MQAIDQSLRALSTASVDLMLMHAPGDPELREETWRALEDAHFEVTSRMACVSLLDDCSVGNIRL